jgi:hypothetical protein
MGSPKAFQKITGNLQWKIDAVCNVRPCDDERKAGGARTMGINEKTMRRTMENNEKYRGPRSLSLWMKKSR